MNTIDLAAMVLSPAEKSEMQASIKMLEQSEFSAFYEKNKGVVQSILFLDNLDEFMDFSSENQLDTECFCAAFLCEKGYGVQIGGYEDDLTCVLSEFFQSRRIEFPGVMDVVTKEKIYTDCSDDDNFKKSMVAINQILKDHGIQLIVLEDFVYCDCEYTVLSLGKAFANNVLSSWNSDNFEIYL